MNCHPCDRNRPRESGRGDWIRTSDPLRPRQVRYQAALRPESSGSDEIRRAEAPSRREGGRQLARPSLPLLPPGAFRHALRHGFLRRALRRLRPRQIEQARRVAVGLSGILRDGIAAISRSPRFTCRMRSRASSRSSAASVLERVRDAVASCRASSVSSAAPPASVSPSTNSRCLIRRTLSSPRGGRLAAPLPSSSRRDPGTPPPTSAARTAAPARLTHLRLPEQRSVRDLDGGQTGHQSRSSSQYI